MLFCSTVLVHHLVVQPFKDPKSNRVETLAIFLMLFVTCLNGLETNMFINNEASSLPTKYSHFLLWMEFVQQIFPLILVCAIIIEEMGHRLLRKPENTLQRKLNMNRSLRL